MATSKRSTGANTRKRGKNIYPDLKEKLLQCAICLNDYTDPRSLDCRHSFCLKCLQEHYESSQHRRGRSEDEKHKLLCPTCQQFTTLPQGEVTNLQIDFRIGQIKDALVHTEKDHMDQEHAAQSGVKRQRVVCEVCDEAWRDQTAEKYCSECGLHLCMQCGREHVEKDVFQHHAVTDWDHQKADPTVVCAQHQKDFKYYCLTCKQCVCPLCVSGNIHTEHDKIAITELLKDRRQQIDAIVIKLDTTGEVIRSKLQNLERTLYEKMEMLDNVEQEMVKHTQRIIDKLRQNETELVHSLTKTRGYMRDLFNKEIDEIRNQNCRIQNVQANARRLKVRGKEFDLIDEYESLFKETLEFGVVAPIPANMTNVTVKFQPVHPTHHIGSLKQEQSTSFFKFLPW